MGHRDTDMVIKVYAKYLKNPAGNADGRVFNDIYTDMIGNGK